MKDLNPETVKIAIDSALATIQSTQPPIDRHAAYIGLDTHKDTIMVAMALPGRQAAEIYGEIPNTKKSMSRLIDKLNKQFEGQLLL